ncbi:prepilin-type N-terminal cleavage/methylation domain-containing protein [Geomesophilobacter sediminis]|uniref:Prepilin-type N-terminal cleavage/methylation domain-containing protein n=1 Tax=Geomesophilobacter sediminis TaxID=2798584 RepID=A0A8J7SCW1_9BACT|nr:prepilin-type N-terminal cleavage/methylation domain-containing protein [Geomesophilobacter sediminis]MBJ6727439.1 prepilin-type N-terminal cleavage/methylation domain-containing protein [Geomesophilobacter sediminis]
MRNNKGFTLIEIVVAMGIFVIVMIMGTYAFQRVLSISGQQMKSAESNIEGVAGLELLRYDVEHAGYGLPWRFQSYSGTIQFRNATRNVELDVAANSTALGFDPTTLNAVSSTNIQAYSAGTATQEVNGAAVVNAAGGPDYLVIRSSMASLDKSARKWTYVNYSANPVTQENQSYLRQWTKYLAKWSATDDFSANDRIITLSSTFTSDGRPDKILLMNGNEFEVTVASPGVLPAGAAFKPADPSQIVVAYGIRNSSTGVLRMPYNRTDYYVRRPATGMPGYCNPGTGILYKAVVSQDTGGFGTPNPVLDCVADLQVEFDYDANNDGNVANKDATILTPGSASALYASDIRDHVKTMKIYILTHEGKKDRNYTYPNDTIHVGDPLRPTSGRTLSTAELASLFGTDWKKYRWKVYTLVTRPKNLNQ